MISVEELTRLIEWPPHPGSPVLSVYLTTDPSKSGNANVRRGFEAVLQNLRRAIETQLTDEPRREHFAADAAAVSQFVAQHEPQERGLVLFSDASEHLFWSRGLRLCLREEARWDEVPYLRPLLEVLDEYERWGVVLTEHGRSRLFTIFMGEVEEHVDAFLPEHLRRLTSIGTDHLWSQKPFQQKVEVHAKWHLKEAARLLDRLTSDYAFDRLILAGPEEPTAELYRLLPKRLRTRVIGRVALPFSAGGDAVLKATEGIIEETERKAEREVVAALLDDAAKKRQAVAGLEPTLLACQEGRIYRLVYVDGLRESGGRCAACGALCAEGCRACPWCGGTLTRIGDLIDALARQVIDAGGKVEVVRGEAARLLDPAGRIGAQLRF